MKQSTFETLLDRHGPDLESWPAAEAIAARDLVSRSAEARRARDLSLRVESWIAVSRPRVDAASSHRVVARALNEIRHAPRVHAAVSGRSFGWLREHFAFGIGIPMPRLAFAVVATAIGFVIGIMLGSPETRQAVHPSGLPVIASAGDVLF